MGENTCSSPRSAVPARAGAQAFRQLRPVEAQIVCVGPQEPGLVGEARKVFEATRLDRLDIDLSNAQVARDMRHVASEDDPRFAQTRTHPGGLETRRNLVTEHFAAGSGDGSTSTHGVGASRQAAKFTPDAVPCGNGISV